MKGVIMKKLKEPKPKLEKVSATKILRNLDKVQKLVDELEKKINYRLGLYEDSNKYDQEEKV
jgi:GH25 family lysozyme M1 (1,4-beta-N-acetylmuramidase)